MNPNLVRGRGVGDAELISGDVGTVAPGVDNPLCVSLPWVFCETLVADAPLIVAALIREYPPFGLNWVWTLDEHDAETPVKRFPSVEEAPYLWRLADVWVREPFIILAKSRQMVITWLFVALNTLDIVFNKGRRVFFQSEKEDHAISLLDRARHVIAHLPRAVRPEVTGSAKIVRIRERLSEIRAFPQGADQVRSYTFSSGFCDEAAFQPEFEAAYAACLPAIKGGGRLTVVSSASPGFFQKLYEDRIGEE